MRNKKGFTLIELLVVIAIIGLLATIAVVALNSARTSSRDAKRIADVRQVQTGLELYFNSKTAYPFCAANELQDLEACPNDGSNGITTYISGVGNIYDPSAGDGGTACLVGAATTCNYSYESTASSEYTILFYLEGASGSLSAGLHTASSAGME
jgi:prepilin-type N-terminal cleavage/methylation domain-containing protein